MTDRRLLRGVELRYALTMYLHQHGTQTVRELVEGLEDQGFGFVGRPSKAVSDALRWEMSHGRVGRKARGRYGPLEMPRSTEYRIHRRVLAMRADAAAMAGDDDTFWDLAAGFG